MLGCKVKTYVHALPQVSHIGFFCLNQLCHDEPRHPDREMVRLSLSTEQSVPHLIPITHLDVMEENGAFTFMTWCTAWAYLTLVWPVCLLYSIIFI